MKRGPRLGSWKGLMLALSLLGVLGLGHWVYWYQARWQPESPDDETAALLSMPWAKAAVWVPFPHQNLRTFEQRFGLGADAADDVLRLTGSAAPELPPFGTMSLPPARSLAVAIGDGDRFAVAARVYPLFAGFARLAGRLAGNPWLSGGQLEWRERSISISWRGGLWTAWSGVEEPRLSRGPGGAAALIVASHQRAESPVPVGLYRLQLVGDDLVLRNDQPASSLQVAGPAEVSDDIFSPAELDQAGALLWLLRMAPSPQGMAFFRQDARHSSELPISAVLHRPGEEDWRLPVASVLKMAGLSPSRSETSGLEIVGSDSRADRGGRQLAPSLARLAADPRAKDVELGVWLDLQPAALELGRLRRGLEASPFISRRQVSRWRSTERLVAGLGLRHRTLRLVIREPRPGQGGQLVLRAEGRAREAGN